MISKTETVIIEYRKNRIIGPHIAKFAFFVAGSHSQAYRHRICIEASSDGIFTARRYAMRCTVFPIVILSVCLSVTLVDCVHMVRPTIMISSPCAAIKKPLYKIFNIFKTS